MLWKKDLQNRGFITSDYLTRLDSLIPSRMTQELLNHRVYKSIGTNIDSIDDTDDNNAYSS